MMNYDQLMTGHRIIKCHECGTERFEHEGGCSACQEYRESLIEEIMKKLERLSTEQLEEIASDRV